jgi:hypothetical protein
MALEEWKRKQRTKTNLGPYCPEFDAFWSRVPRKEPSKRAAFWAWLQALSRGATPDEILAGLERWGPVWESRGDLTYVPHITTWLNNDQWTVERPVARESKSHAGYRGADDVKFEPSADDEKVAEFHRLSDAHWKMLTRDLTSSTDAARREAQKVYRAQIADELGLSAEARERVGVARIA